MKFNVLHNFISPVTGRVLCDYNYVLLGNSQGIAIPSPILLDIRLDLIRLTKRYNTLVTADFVIGHPNSELPKAQVLVDLDDGFMYNTAGIVSTLLTFPQIPLCYTATTEDLDAIYDNGDSGIGATLTYSGSGTFVIDGQTPPVNSIIFVKDQSSSYENGIYTLTNTGGILTSWILTRLSTYDQSTEIQDGDLVAVEYGTVNAQTLWVETQDVSIIGTDPILFIQLGSSLNDLPQLPYTNIWIGNEDNVATPEPYIQLGNLPPLFSLLLFDPLSLPVPGAPVNFGYNNIYTGGLSPNVSSPITPSITLRTDTSNLPNLSKGKMWIGTINITPPITLDTIPPYIHITGDLNWDLRGASFDKYAVPQEIGLDPGWVFIGDSENPGQIIAASQILQSTLPPLASMNIWIGNNAGTAVPMTQIYESNLPPLTENYVWIGNEDDVAEPVLFEITAGTGLTTSDDEPITGNGTILIADTEVEPGTYDYATITVNAQGQLTFAESNTPSEGTVTEIDTGTGLIGGPITDSGTISIDVTGVIAGPYAYASFTVNAEGQLTTATDNTTEINDINDNIAANTTAIGDINTFLFDPVTGFVTLVDAAVFAPVTGLVDVVGGLVIQVATNTSNIATNTTDISTNTTDISINTGAIAATAATVAGIISGGIPISANFTGVGDVSGSGPLSSDITLTLNTTLNNVPLATGDVDFNNYAITDLETLSFSSWNDMENKAQNGINFLFLWQFFGGGVS